MVVENFVDFWEWLSGGNNLANGAWLTFIYIAVACALVGLFFGYLITVLRHGPFEAFYVCSNVVFKTLPDIFGTSPRRILAMARLSIKEAMHRRVIIVSFLIFAIAMLFSGWFMNSGGEHPERVFVNFVMFGAQVLILLMTLLISAFSFPEDIRNKTIYTIATKPVRPTEMILGRIAGFAALGTAMLSLMALLSLAFVWGGLQHSHKLDLDDPTEDGFVEIGQEESGRRPSDMAIKEAFTTWNSGHRHVVEILEDVRAVDAPPPSNMDSVIRQEDRGDKIAYYRVAVKPEAGHTHTATVDKSTGNISISGPKGYFRSRVPFYASSLVFIDRQGLPRYRRDIASGEIAKDEKGNEITEGTNPGDIWTYRGYIDGGQGTLARAQYNFENFHRDLFDNADLIPLEITVLVFRSYKGDVAQGVKIGLQFESIPDDPQKDPVFRSEVMKFESDEFDVQVHGVPRKMAGSLISPKGEQIREGFFDLFEDYAANGKIRISLSCRDMNQYIGVAKADVYFRAREGQYWVNFLKGYFGIWLQMMIVISLTVALSTFLSSPVTLLVTVSALVFGFFADNIRHLTLPSLEGGGPIESFWRLITQQNMTTKLQETQFVSIMQSVDGVLIKLLDAITRVVPDFSQLSFSEFVKYGYNIDNGRMLVATAITFAFCVGVSVFAYFCLKTRELAA